MTKVRLLVLLAVVALVLSPAMVFAQGPQLPCRFHGTVQVNGADVPDGTIVTATIEGDAYNASTPSNYGDSTYMLEIAPPEGTNYTDGAAITFMIGDQSAAQTGTWEAGGNFELNLSSGQVQPTIGPGGAITSVTVNTLAAGASATADWDSATGALTLGIPQGAAGADGAAGDKGDTGEQGEAGANASSVLGIVAIVIAALAIVMSVAVMRRKV